MLYLVATPIGNLEDFTLRAISVLKNVDLILCEDTRRSRILLKKYQITTPYQSFEKYSEQKKLEKILKSLLNNQDIALISDAGTPLINDPGYELVKLCRENNILVTSIPGACSIISALILSNLTTVPFQFVGFLPKKGSALKKYLFYQGTTIAFESPHRIKKTVELINQLDSQRKCTIVRELTKAFEDVVTGKPKDLLIYLSKQKKLGEIILLIDKNENYISNEKDDEIIKSLQEYLGLSSKNAIKYAAKLLNKPKKELYQKEFIKKIR